MSGDPSFNQKKQSVNSQTNIASQTNNYGASAPPPVPQITQPPADFTGREEEIAEILANFNQGANITGLRGMGGVGKTALALSLAERLKDRFPDGQIFLKLDGMSENPLSPAEALSKVIRAFRGFGERLPEDQDDLQGLYSSVLAGKHVLVLLDNAADGKQVEPLIPPKGCALLITSRKKFSLPGMPEPFFLDTLKPSDAQNFLLKICPRMGDNSEELAELCGHLPLALRAAASLLAVKKDLNPSSYLEELRSERTRLKKIGKEGVELDVEASFNLSYIRLPAEMARVFRQLSVFPSDFDSQAEEFVCQDENHLNLSELVTLSLLELLEAGRYRMHDLARVFADSRLEADARELAQQRHAKHYQELLWKANGLFIQGGDSLSKGLIQFDTDWVNIQKGQEWAKINAFKSPEIAEICSNFALTGTILGLRLPPLRNIGWLEAALVAVRKTKNQNAECAHMGNLGSAYADLSEQRKAIEYHEQALKISREIGYRQGEGSALGNLGLAYYYLGESRKAIEYYDQALTISREIRDRHGEGNHLGNLGLAYSNLGQSFKAIEYHEQALKISREIGDRWGEGAHLGNLGLAYSNLGQPLKAIEYHEQALKISREIGNKRGEGNSLDNLGLVQLGLNKPIFKR
jgi:tetratricopeptide (TPR) repeat protein